MGNGHAILSPSASGRWLSCPASVRMTRDLPREESIYAREGTLFHTLCELVARHKFLDSDEAANRVDRLDWSLELEDDWQEEQEAHARAFLEFLQGHLEEEPGATLLLEQRVDTGIPGCWGTADAVIIYSDRVRVIDIKYGAGVKVSAVDNSQLRLYGLGALSLVEDPLEIEEVTVTIWQPRMNNVSEETLTRKELLRWRDEIMPIAKLALTEDAPFGPSEDACRWCPIAGDCKAQMKWMLNRDYGDPDLLTGEEMAEAFEHTKPLKKWISQVEDAALKRAYEEAGSVPGFKVVQSGGRRQIMDEDEAINILLTCGFHVDDVAPRKIATLGQLDKLARGKDSLKDILGDALGMSEGRLSLAPESDSRPPADALHSAKMDFADVANEGEA